MNINPALKPKQQVYILKKFKLKNGELLDPCPDCEGTGKCYNKQGKEVGKCPPCKGAGGKRRDTYRWLLLGGEIDWVNIRVYQGNIQIDYEVIAQVYDNEYEEDLNDIIDWDKASMWYKTGVISEMEEFQFTRGDKIEKYLDYELGFTSKKAALKELKRWEKTQKGCSK